MHTFRRTLTVAAVTAVGTLTFALPAWANHGEFTATCDHVTLSLEEFPSTDVVVHVTRNGKSLPDVTVSGHTSVDFDETYPDGTEQYLATWMLPGSKEVHTAPKDGTPAAMSKPPTCKPDTPPPPTDTATATPSATPSSAAPVSSPIPPSPTPSPKVEAAKLANTGAGNTVPLLLIGTVLVAGGVALTVVTRRRHGGSTSS
ncbi:MAG TPA: LPXTG cell wall anchor domain-containing protein [Mycobacteriales bacterium]|nr:LPXTG cell wall anchor domain-containing protein [Mycobacteriales bacterium]